MKQFDFPLADEPMLGDWKISVSFQGDVTSTTFEVKEYGKRIENCSFKNITFILTVKNLWYSVKSLTLKRRMRIVNYCLIIYIFFFIIFICVLL